MTVGATASMFALLGALAIASPVGALPLPRADYPTWDEVQQARNEASAAAELVATIGGLLDDLQAESARLGELALQHGAAAAAAEQRRDSAAAAADRLDRQADAAAERASISSARAAQVVAVMARSAGPDLGLALLADHDEDLLVQLGMLDRVGGQLEAVVQVALIDRNTSTALAAQADQARKAAAEAAKAARTAAQEAERAAAEADARVADQQAHLSELYAQLALLQGTSAEQERLYRIGQQVGDAPNTPGPGTPSEPGGGGPAPDPGGGDDLGSIGSQYNDPAAAQAYAWSWFPNFGWEQGAESWCLVLLWNRESNWRTNAYNASSGAYGIPQSLPGSKMAAVGPDWRTNYQTQVIWGLVYISNRYGHPCGAWAHSEAVGWY